MRASILVGSAGDGGTPEALNAALKRWLIPMTETPRIAAADSVGREVVDFARRAPSVHNTQPWAWRVRGRRVDLYADPERQLLATDPDGRNLTISCGAALHYAVAGAAAAGWAAETEVDAGPGTHLATLRLSPSEPSGDAVAYAELLSSRTTDRRPFIGWPVPPSVLTTLTAPIVAGSASVVPVTSTLARLRLEQLVGRADAVERADPRRAREQHAWIENGAARTVDGVPRVNARPALVGQGAPAGQSRFDPDPAPESALDDRPFATLLEPTDGLLVIVADTDTRASWLDAGDALCRLWVAAMEHGLSLVPNSQVMEVPETRAAVRHSVLPAPAHPMLLVRLGWQELARSPLPATPRRPVDDQLLR